MISPRIMKYNPAFLSHDELIRSFVVRQVDLELIIETIHQNIGATNQHIVIIGARGTGKTSLALRVAAETREKKDLGDRWYPLAFGEESYNIHSPGEFWLEALFHVAEQTNEERWERTHRELVDEKDEERLRHRALAQLMDFADEQGKRILLIVENLNMLLSDQMSDDDAWVLRHTLQNEPRLMLLGTAVSRFEEIDGYEKAFYDFFKIHELKPLNLEECLAFWKAVTGEEPDRHHIRPLHILTGGNLRLLAILFTFAAGSSFRELTQNLILLVDEHTEHFKSHLDGLPAIERKVFVALADLWDPATARDVAQAARIEVNKASSFLNRLVERGVVETAIVKGRKKWYQVAERMYNIYHLMRRRGRLSRRVNALIAFMLAFYYEEVDPARQTSSTSGEPSQSGPDSQSERIGKILSDPKTTEGHMHEVIDFFLHAAAEGNAKGALNTLESSPAASILEPLSAGLRLCLKEEVLAPQEIKGVAEDICERIISRRAGMNNITWLHLSDFHFRTEGSLKASNVEDYNRTVVLDALLEDLKEYPAQNGLRIDFIVITGDIAFSGQEDEYKAVEHFLDRLLRVTGVAKDRLFIVPGNHDVDRGKINPFINISLDTGDQINGFLMDKKAKEIAFEKFDGFRDFIARYFEDAVPFDYEDNYFWLKSVLINGTKVNILGLNSAWNSRDDHDRGNLLIGERQVTDALKRAEKSNLTIAAFHHPLDWLRDNDADSIRRRLGQICQFFLHGHMHRPGYKIETTPDDQVITIPAGACYEKRPYSNSYNYITINPETRKGTLHLRRYVDSLQCWRSDNETFRSVENGIMYFDLEHDPGIARRAQPQVALEIPDTYRRWIDTLCAKMDIERLVDSKDHRLISLTLPEIFIPLYTNAPGAKEQMRRTRAKIDAEQMALLEERQAAANIEKLAADSEYLLIKGQPGSGKTTLMKHLAYTIIRGENEHGFHGYLPVLVFLKDLPALDIHPEKAIQGTRTAERILTQYFENAGAGLTVDLIKAFCAAGRALFLIDGLDEIEPKLRQLVVSSFANFRSDYEGGKMLLAGRPHGIDAHVNNHFGDGSVEINPLNMEQVEQFIAQWCIWDEDLKARGITPSAMFGQIREHPNIDELIATPLMLTAACILYHYDKRLPDQRAELYEKFIDNLIYKRFENPEEILDFLMKLASKTHHARKRDFGKSFAIDLLAPERPRRKGETQRQHRQRVAGEFTYIEEKSGLLKEQEGQHGFWHLTFQEFLTAVDIAVHETTDYAEVIRPYWDDDWYEEVVQLFIGHLSNSNRGIANDIVRQELDRPESSPFRHWRLASRALLAIHANKRNAEVVEKAQDRLLAIFEREVNPKNLADAGETLGRLGDTRDLEEFIPVEGGTYKLDEVIYEKDTHHIEEREEVLLKPFELSKYPVTNSWYAEFIEAGGYKNEDCWSKEGKKWLEKSKAECPRLWHDRRWNCPNAPVVGVSWYEADAFCKWLSQTRKDGYLYSLPKEQEWQAAAAGKKKREYPWGPWKKDICNTAETDIDKTSSVGIFKKSDTPEGVADLAGNVWEWTCSDYKTKEQQADFVPDELGPVLRGGSWFSGGRDARCACRGSDGPSGRDDNIGFRCARTKK